MLREYVSLTVARVMKYSIYGHLLFDWVYWGCSRGCYCCSLARQPYFFLLLVSPYRKLPRGTDFTGILNNFDIIIIIILSEVSDVVWLVCMDEWHIYSRYAS